MSYTPQAWGVIHAECASKANSRRLVKFGRRIASIKSEKALAFLEVKPDQTVQQVITGPVQLSCRIYYSSRRPDLDPSMVMDWLQKHGIIENDRQIFDLHATKHIDPENPRVEWSVRQIPEPADVRAERVPA